MSVLELRDVHRIHGHGETEVHALSGVTLTVAAGELVAVMGPSGSGKSTFMNLAAGLDDPTSGEVWVAGHPLHRMDDDARTLLRREHVGFVFQAFNLVPTLTAAENITLPMDIAGRDPDKAWVDNVIATVGLTDRLKHKPTELSGGQQQRVAAARALASKPEIVFADEPTGNLDSKASLELLGFLKQAVTEHGQTIVMVTHDATAAGFSDHVIFLGDGRIVDQMDAPTADGVLDKMKSLGG
jgi:putative ABC transport system ATP-binding protein